MDPKAFENKRIMMVGQEGYCYPFYFLSKKWKKLNKLAVFFYNSPEGHYNECYFNRNTYYAFKRLECVRIYDSNAIADEFNRIVKKTKIIDEGYLEYIEKEYTHYYGINEQIISSQKTSQQYHWRHHYKKMSMTQQLNWLILNYKNVERILEDFAPDVILDNEQAEMARAVLREVSYKKGIPYICLEHTRFDSYQIPNFSLGVNNDEFFVREYEKNMELSDEALRPEILIVEDWRKQGNIMTIENRRFFRKKNLLTVIKKIAGYFSYYYDEDIRSGNRRLKLSNPYIYANSNSMIKDFIKVEVMASILSKKNKYFSVPVEGEKYVYMPLHLIPESSTFTKSPLYINEISIIEAVSKTLPAGWWLYVKEHHAMIGERGLEFYQRVNELPNARMVQYNYYDDPRPWIIRSKGVITISGTSAFEATMLNKPSIVFADVPFQLIDGVYRLHSFEELKDVFIEFESISDNRKSCAAYIKAVKELGDNVDMAYLFQQGELIMRHIEKIDREYKKALIQFENVYLKGLCIHNQQKMQDGH